MYAAASRFEDDRSPNFSSRSLVRLDDDLVPEAVERDAPQRPSLHCLQLRPEQARRPRRLRLRYEACFAMLLPFAPPVKRRTSRHSGRMGSAPRSKSDFGFVAREWPKRPEEQSFLP